MKAQAPWPDYKGQTLHEGDEIIHPSGERGVILFKSERGPIAGDCWLVKYEDSEPLSRLILQIGDKGQAVKVAKRQLG